MVRGERSLFFISNMGIKSMVVKLIYGEGLLKIYERALVPHVVKFFQKRGYIVFTEQYIGYGRADVVSIILNENEVQKRIEHKIPRLPIKTLLRIMRILDKQGEMSIKEIAEFLGYSSSYIRNIITCVNPLYLLNENGIIRKIK